MPDPKAAGVGPSAEADCRRGAGVSQRHHCLMVIAPPAGCLKMIIISQFIVEEIMVLDLFKRYTAMSEDLHIYDFDFVGTWIVSTQ